jgi:hypothetical protein
MALRDIIDLLGTVSTIKRQQEAQALAEQHERTGAFGQFQQLLQHTRGAEEMVPLIHSFSQATGINEEALRDQAMHYQAPSGDISSGLFGDYVRQTAGTPAGQSLQRETAYAQGTGQSAGAAARSGAQQQAFAGLGGEMRRQFDAQTLSGMSLGGLAQDSAMASLPMNDLAAGARIKIGTQTSQPQKDQLSLEGTVEGEKLNYQDRALGQSGILGLMGINAREQNAEGHNSMIEGARSRYLKNLQDITQKPQSTAAQRTILDNMQEDYDLIHGQGSFIKRYPNIYSDKLNPSLILRLMTK